MIWSCKSCNILHSFVIMASISPQPAKKTGTTSHRLTSPFKWCNHFSTTMFALPAYAGFLSSQDAAHINSSFKTACRWQTCGKNYEAEDLIKRKLFQSFPATPFISSCHLSDAKHYPHKMEHSFMLLIIKFQLFKSSYGKWINVSLVNLVLHVQV